MAYRLPKSSVAPVPPPVVRARDRGRPRIYDGQTLPVSFRVPEYWRVEGSIKARQHRFNLTELFAIYYRNFLTQHITETQRFVKEWKEAHGLVHGPLWDDNDPIF